MSYDSWCAPRLTITEPGVYNQSMRAAFILASFALLACANSLAPVTIGTDYQLRPVVLRGTLLSG